MQFDLAKLYAAVAPMETVMLKMQNVEAATERNRNKTLNLEAAMENRFEELSEK